MELTPFAVYLISQLDEFIWIFKRIAFLSFAGSAVLFWAFILFRVGSDSERAISKSIFRVFIVAVSVCLVSGIASVIMPSSRTAAAMLVLPPIINDQDVQQLPKSVVKLANKKIQEFLGEPK